MHLHKIVVFAVTLSMSHLLSPKHLLPNHHHLYQPTHLRTNNQFSCNPSFRYWMKAWRAAMMFQRAWDGYYAIVKLRKFRMARRIQCKWRRYWALKTVKTLAFEHLSIHILLSYYAILIKLLLILILILISFFLLVLLSFPCTIGSTHLSFQTFLCSSICLYVWFS